VLAITAKMGWDDADITVGKLFRIWRWFDQQTTDGNAAGVTSSLLDRIVGVTGFCEAMQSIGWLCISVDGISLPNFDRHNGNTAKSRSLTAKRGANHKSNSNGNDASVTEALPKRYLEKRREEKKSIKEANASLSETSFPTCPYKKLIGLWAKNLPHLTQPRTWEGSRQTNMRNRWLQAGKPSAYSPEGSATTDDGLKWWDSFFGYIASDTKLAAGFESNGRTWQPDLEWVVNASNFQKIIDGKYNK